MIERRWVAMVIVVGACGGGAAGGQGSYYSKYPSAQRPPATQEMRDRIAANAQAIGLPGFSCARLRPLLAGENGMSGSEVPGGYQTMCSVGEGAANETYRVQFAPQKGELSVNCLVRASLKGSRCTEIVSALLD